MSTTYNGVIYEELSIDVSQNNEFAPRLVKQKDAYTRGYIITLTQGGEKLTIPTSGTTAWFNARNQTDPTKRASTQGTIGNDGTVSVIVPAVVMEVAGYIQCDVSVITVSGNDTHILKSTLFYLSCEAAANPDGTTSVAEDSILAGIAAGNIVPPAAPYVPKTRKIANIPLSNDIAANMLLRALEAPHTTWDNDAPTGSDTGIMGDFWVHYYTADNVTHYDLYFCCGVAGATLWQKLATMSDIPTVLSALANDCNYIPIYSAESAPPTTSVETMYSVPCMWIYDSQLWLVWGRNTITVPGQNTKYAYTYQKLETVVTGSGSSIGDPFYDGQIGFLPAASNNLRYGYGGNWYVLANEAYVNKYSPHTMSYTLASSSWSSQAQTLNISSSGYTVTNKTKVDIQIDDTAYTALLAAGCMGLYVTNNSGSLVVHALGVAPTSNVTVQLTISEVMTL